MSTHPLSEYAQITDMTLVCKRTRLMELKKPLYINIAADRGVFRASCGELPALHGSGKTVEEAFSMILQEIDRHLSGSAANADHSIEECYAATCASGGLRDWDTPEEDAAWQHLQ